MCIIPFLCHHEHVSIIRNQVLSVDHSYYNIIVTWLESPTPGHDTGNLPGYFWWRMTPAAGLVNCLICMCTVTVVAKSAVSWSFVGLFLDRAINHSAVITTDHD